MNWIMCLLFLTSQLLYGQTIPNPRFLHEQLTIGASFQSVAARVGKLREISQDQFANPFFKNDAATFSLSYVDTLFGNPGAVSLCFSKSDSLLNLIQVTFLGVDPKTGKSSTRLDQSMEALWDSLSNHFGIPQKDKKIPLMGKVRVWFFGSIEVQLLRLTSGTSIVTAQYTRRK
jgi:hypothetical protein